MRRFAKAVAAAALTIGLMACSSSSMELTALDEVSGVKVTAENAGSGQEAASTGAIEVAEGDAIVVSPFLEKGSFHLTITASDGASTPYDDDASGQVLFYVDAAPGTYDVKVSGNDATGWMTVFAESKEQSAELDASLGEALEEAVPGGVEGITQDAGDAS